MTTENRTPLRRSNSKSVLICSLCERTAPIDDSWPVVRNDDRTDVECPECGAIVVSQPIFESDVRKTPITA